MGWLIAAFGALWIVVIVWDAFEAIVLSRRVTRVLAKVMRRLSS